MVDRKKVLQTEVFVEALFYNILTVVETGYVFQTGRHVCKK